MSIQELRRGEYQVRVSRMVLGKQRFRQKAVRGTKGYARQWEKRLENELAALEDELRMPTWKTALEQYLSHVNKIYATSTYHTRKTILKYYTSSWEKRRVDQIDGPLIQLNLDLTLEGCESEYKQKVYSYVRSVFDYLIKRGVLEVNPVEKVFPKKRRKQEKLSALNLDEMKRFLKAADEMKYPWYPIWRVVYELGLRSGEAIALRWKNVDLKQKIVRIDSSYCRQGKSIGPTKTGQARTVSLNEGLVEFLEKRRQENFDDEFVLPRLREWKNGEASKIMRAFLRDLGIQEVNFHSLRASFITHLLSENVPVTKVQKMVGHADLKTTQRYVRLTGSDLKGATDCLDLSEFLG
jgi:integrase